MRVEIISIAHATPDNVAMIEDWINERLESDPDATVELLQSSSRYAVTLTAIVRYKKR